MFKDKGPTYSVKNIIKPMQKFDTNNLPNSVEKYNLD
jgi:hypothetical protein